MEVIGPRILVMWLQPETQLRNYLNLAQSGIKTPFRLKGAFTANFYKISFL